jgi:hypothetical protein
MMALVLYVLHVDWLLELLGNKTLGNILIHYGLKWKTWRNLLYPFNCFPRICIFEHNISWGLAIYLGCLLHMLLTDLLCFFLNLIHWYFFHIGFVWCLFTVVLWFFIASFFILFEYSKGWSIVVLSFEKFLACLEWTCRSLQAIIDSQTW